MLMPSADAQEGVDKFTIAPFAGEEMNWLLENEGTFARKIDFSFIKGKPYLLHIFLEEYRNREKTGNIFYNKYETSFSDENWSYELDNILVSFKMQNDSTSMFNYKIGEYGGGRPIKLHRNEGIMSALYHERPFILDEFDPGKRFPVMVYGSAYSEKQGELTILRFCMDNELPANMEHEAFDNMPHYVILFLQLDKLSSSE